MFPFLEHDDDRFLISILLQFLPPYPSFLHFFSFGPGLALRTPVSANFAAKLIEAQTPSGLVNVILASPTIIILSFDLRSILIFVVASTRDTVLERPEECGRLGLELEACR